QVRVRHPQRPADAIEAQRAVGALEAQGMRHRHFTACANVEPLVHAPEMTAPYVELERIDQSRDQWQLLGRPDRPADADRRIVSALPPRLDVFERLGEVEVLERVVQDDLEPGPG